MDTLDIDTYIGVARNRYQAQIFGAGKAEGNGAHLSAVGEKRLAVFELGEWNGGGRSVEICGENSPEGQMRGDISPACRFG
jgi:hypothetical protein